MPNELRNAARRFPLATTLPVTAVALVFAQAGNSVDATETPVTARHFSQTPGTQIATVADWQSKECPPTEHVHTNETTFTLCCAATLCENSGGAYGCDNWREGGALFISLDLDRGLYRWHNNEPRRIVEIREDTIVIDRFDEIGYGEWFHSKDWLDRYSGKLKRKLDAREEGTDISHYLEYNCKLVEHRPIPPKAF